MSNLTSILGTDLISNAPSVLNGNFDALNTSKAEITSPSLLGVPIAPTPATTNNSNQIATTGFVQSVIGTIGSGTMPTFITTSPFQGAITNATYNANSSVVSQVGLFQLPIEMSVNKVSLHVVGHTTAGSLRLGIYNATGQTQVASMIFASVAGTGMVSANVSSVALAATSYYYAVAPLEGEYTLNSAAPTNNIAITGSVIGKPRYVSSIVTSGGALPSSFNPTTLGIIAPNFINIRLDN